MSQNSNKEQVAKHFGDLLAIIQNPSDPKKRRKAEEDLESLRESNPLKYFQILVEIATKHKNPNNCEPNKPTFKKIDSKDWPSLQDPLLNILLNEKEHIVYKNVCHAIGTLASRVVPQGSWSNLLKKLVQLAKQENTFHKEGFMLVLESLAEFAIKEIEPQFSNIRSVIISALKDSNEDVRLASFRTYSSIVGSIKVNNKLIEWKDIIKLCLDTLKTKNEENLHKSYTCIIDLCVRAPVILHSVQLSIIKYSIATCRNDKLSYDTRKLCLEILILLSKTGNNIRNNSDYIRQTNQLIFLYTSLYNDNLDINNSSDDDEQEFVILGCESARHFINNIGAKNFVTLGKGNNIIKDWMLSSNWKHQYSALQVLRFTIHGLKLFDGYLLTDYNKDNKNKSSIVIEAIVKQVCQFILKHEKTEIKFISLTLLKDLFDHYKEDLTLAFSNQLLSMLNVMLNNYKSLNKRILIELLDCISHYNANGLPNVLINYSDNILKILNEIISNNNDNNEILLQIKISAVTAVATTAHVIGDKFNKFYSIFFKLMLDILIKCTKDDKHSQLLRGKSMEAIGMIGEAVGCDKFKSDAHKLMSILLPLRKKLSSFNDTTSYNYMNHLFARISRTIGNEFIKYFKNVIPYLMKSCSINAGNLIKPDDPNPINPNYHIITMHVRCVGDAKLIVNPIALDEKQTACMTLYQLCKDQPIGFFPYCVGVARLMITLMRYPYHIDIRVSSTAMVPLLLKSIIFGLNDLKNRNKLSLLDNNKKIELKEIFNKLFNSLMKAILLEPDTNEQIPLLEILTRSLAVLHNPKTKKFWELKNDHLISISEVVETIFKESIQRKEKRYHILEQTNDDTNNNNKINASVDEKDKDDFEFEDEIESYLIANCIDVIEYTYWNVGELYVSYFNKYLFLHIKKLIEYNKFTSNDKLQGICLIIDTVEMGGKSGIELFNKYLYICINRFINNYFNDLDLYQTLIYGLGILAINNCIPKNDINKWLNELKNIYMKIINKHKNNQNLDEDIKLKETYVLDNCLSTILKILKNCLVKKLLNNNNILNILNWCINYLPITDDVDEMDSIVNNLLYFINEFKNKLINNNNKNITKNILYTLYFYISNYKIEPTTYEIIMLSNKYMGDKEEDLKKMAHELKVPVLKINTIVNVFNCINELKKILPKQLFEYAQNQLNNDEKLCMQLYFKRYVQKKS